jgi:hypothetical protein
MSLERKSPVGLAERVASRQRGKSGVASMEGWLAPGTWRRVTFTLPRGQARDKAREWFERFPKAAYMTEIEFWKELSDGRIEFTIRRLPSAD